MPPLEGKSVADQKAIRTEGGYLLNERIKLEQSAADQLRSSVRKNSIAGGAGVCRGAAAFTAGTVINSLQNAAKKAGIKHPEAEDIFTEALDC